MKRILGIFRSACYSPGMTQRDEAILRTVAERLNSRGYEISLIHEEDFTPETPMPDIVLHMARSPQALDILELWQKAGCRIINSADSIHHVERATLATLCIAQGIPTPCTWIISTSNPQTNKIIFPCWIKRTGTCAQEPDDVCRANNKEEYTQRIARFQARGIEKVVVMQHLEGQCIKFYAVRDTGFFHCLPAYDKWSGSVTVSSSEPKEYTNNTEIIKRDIIYPIEKDERLPMIYGGDAIISPDGTAYLIDLNDWPSFSACREEAAEAISHLVIGG